MRFRVAVRQRAEADIRDTRDWYKRISPELARRFGAELGRLLHLLASDPLIYAPVYRDVRRAMTKHFPYAVYFIVTRGRVSILRVLHQARDPRERPPR